LRKTQILIKEFVLKKQHDFNKIFLNLAAIFHKNEVKNTTLLVVYFTLCL